MDNHTSLVSNSDQRIVRRISASPSGAISATDDVSGDEEGVVAFTLSSLSGSAGGEGGSSVRKSVRTTGSHDPNNVFDALVGRYASWTVNLQPVVPLDDKTSRVFKALGGKAGTHDIIPEQFRGYKNVCNIQLQLIHSESDHIIALQRIVEDFDVARARLVLPDTMAEKGQGRVLFLFDYPALSNGDSRPLEPGMNGLPRQTSLQAGANLFVNIFQAMGLTREVATHVTMGTLVFANVLMIGLPSSFATDYPYLTKRLLIDTRDSTCQILRKIIALCHPDLFILTFGHMSTTNGREMLESIDFDGLILNNKNLSHPMCDTRGWTKPTQRDYIVGIALQAANKVAMGLGLIKKELTMETLSEFSIDIELLYSCSPGATLGVPSGINESLDEREAEMKCSFAAEKEAAKAEKEAAKKTEQLNFITQAESNAVSTSLSNTSSLDKSVGCGNVLKKMMPKKRKVKLGDITNT